MFETDGDQAQITFQWVVGDLRALEKNLHELSKPPSGYAIMVGFRLIAYALTFAVAYALLPDANFHTVLWIALAGSLSIWASLGLELLTMRTLERIQADDPRRVGWNSMWLDRSGITVATEIMEEYVSWLGVTDIVERDGSLWIKTGPARGFYIPSRVFASDDETIECKMLVERFRAKPLPPKHLLAADDEMLMH